MFTRKLFGSFLRGLAAAAVLALAGCGGGGSGGDQANTPTTPAAECDASACGTVLVSFTDADGDFLSYTVDVVKLSLQRANGAQVEVLPVQPRVDFAELVELRELVTAATVPNGAYVQGTIQLDYTNAEIVVDVGGVPTPAVAVDANGQPLTTVDLEIRLDNRRHLVIAPGRPSLLELDFDLLASNTVDLTSTPAQVTVQPFIVASVDHVDSREGRVRGPLLSVDTADSSYRIDVRPFNHRAARLGTLTVHTTASTEFEIDGVAYTGAEGLAALADLEVGSPTAAYGVLDINSREFTAKRVHAGTSVAGPQYDVIRGNVIARTGDELTVRGATLIRRSGSVTFVRDDVTLLVGPDTKITKDGYGNNALGTEALSVGQRIHAFGVVSENADGVTLDATEGRVRMHLTHAIGLVESVLPGLLTLDLHAIDGHRSAVFDFSGTGVTPAQDADPSAYEVATGNLDLSRMQVGSAARVFGFVNPFGAAPPDFEGRTLVSFEEVLALLSVGWGLEGTDAPFLSLDEGGIVIDTDNQSIGGRHFIAIGPTLIDILDLGAPLRIVTDASKPGVYAIGEPHRVEMYEDFAEFTAKVAEKLGAGGKVRNLTASGHFDGSTSELTSQRLLVSFSPTT